MKKMFANTTTDTAAVDTTVTEPRAETVPEAALVPLAVIVPEVAELGITTIDQLAARLCDDVAVVAGLMRCTTRERVTDLAAELAQLRAQKAQAAAQAAERLAEAAAARASVLQGRPAEPGKSAYEVMMAGEKDGAFASWELQLEAKREGTGVTFGPHGIPFEEDQAMRKRASSSTSTPGRGSGCAAGLLTAGRSPTSLADRGGSCARWRVTLMSRVPTSSTG